METKRITYNDKVARQFIAASVAWGLVGMLVGVIVALQLAVWQTNLAPWLTFGRLRPLHTNAVIFAFVGNMMFAGVYHSTQRLLKARLASDALSQIHFWGWQLIILAAAITLPLGITQSKEYAELEWPIDIMVAVVWLVFAVNFFWTIAKRNEKHLYVAIWFYIATVVTITVLYVVNNLAIPAGMFDSYPVFAGAQDALVQWWYGHNAVAFFLTTPILGIMYYYLPKAAERPVFSYRLSIVHFWGLVFLYIWAGPHHLLNTALPEWAQTLGMVFSLMLWAPSWGGMLNGLLTLRGAWDKLRKDPILKFFAAGVTFYGMATFEGPLLSIRAVSALGHYTDWIIGHAHAGALGWNGFMAAGMFYYLVPRLFGTKIYSQKAANLHFYVGTIGILMYVVAMWVSGITQGLMWRAETEDGGLLYQSFTETVIAIIPMYWFRMIGGSLYLVGMGIMAWNLLMTAKGQRAVDGEVEVVVEPEEETVGWKEIVLSPPVLLVTVVGGLVGAVAVVGELGSTLLVSVAVVTAILGTMALQLSRSGGGWHRLLEGKSLVFTVFITIAVLIGGIAELVPTFVVNEEAAQSSPMRPYTALELHGRDVYVSEGCYTCHSQMIRPFTWEAARYPGGVSTMNDSVWDHPFQWGSKRTGPDLARESAMSRGPVWHYNHMLDPRSTSPGSIMPSYPHLRTTAVDFDSTRTRLSVMQTLGVPYGDAEVEGGEADARAQARHIAGQLAGEVELDGPFEGTAVALEDSQLVALVSYLERLGRNRSEWTGAPEEGEGAAPVEVSDARRPVREGEER
ncbi:MAG: cytochrome-c oxidase, cbb3-type subunit I [Sandaracinaceae bacterium]|nr:cytochrome-c oxidase, cbb3-type subunit I [Sandaracinaceae bacterium]